MTTFQANNAYFGTQALVGTAGTTSNAKLSATNLVITSTAVGDATTYSRTGIASSVSTGTSFDITTKGLTFNSLAGAVGNLLLSGGSTAVPTWLTSPAVGNYLTSGGVGVAPVWAAIPTPPTAYTILRGSITPSLLAVTGTLTFSPAFTGTIPYVTLTVDTASGSTTVIPVGLAGVGLTTFNWVLGTSLSAGQTINWIAIQ
jgi:hypothetical protein